MNFVSNFLKIQMKDFLCRLKFSTQKKIPVLLQSETTECASACIAMIAAYHGNNKSMAEVRSLRLISQKGATLRQTMRLADALGLSSRALRIELDELRELQLPCILHWDFNHFVVLVHVSRNKIVIHDPGAGRRMIAIEEASNHFTGVALEILPGQSFEKQDPAKGLKIRDVFGKVAGLKRSLSYVIAIALVLQVLTLATPLFLQQVVDRVAVDGDTDLLLSLGLGFILLTLISNFLTVVRRWQIMCLSTVFNLQWSGNVFSKIMRLPVEYFERRHVGDIISRFSSTGAIQSAVTGTFVEAIVDGFMSITIFLTMLAYSAKLTFITLLALSIYFVVRTMLLGPLRNASNEYVSSASIQQSFLIETIRGVRSIKLFDNQVSRTGRWLNLAVETSNRNVTRQRLEIFGSATASLIQGIERIAVIWVGATIVISGKGFSIGMMLAFLAYKDQFYQRSMGLIDKIYEMKLLGVHVERLADIVLNDDDDDDTGPLSMHPTSVGLCKYLLEVENVGFRYAVTEPAVFQNVHIKIESGDFIAFIGPSGCGKTTLLKLLLGILPCSEGVIKYKGLPLEKIGLRAYREKIATVLQDDCLFSGTIMENIAFFDANTDHIHLYDCARRAAILDEIMVMPMQFNTLVGDMGAALSGGQKQRILLARALYKKPEILILDEATSHLDANNEHLVSEAISQLKITRIVVAHRKETINMADRVYEFKQGAPVECVEKQSFVA